MEGVAYHLVSKHEDTKNGYAAWKSLVDWSDGDMIQNETAENLRNKLENLRLHTGVSASEYINKFCGVVPRFGQDQRRRTIERTCCSLVLEEYH
jgi:hypothetical protein